MPTLLSVVTGGSGISVTKLIIICLSAWWDMREVPDKEGSICFATGSDRERITKQIGDALSRFDDVVLAYLYGSFLTGDDFHDIDIGIIVSREMEPYESLRFAVGTAAAVERNITPRYEVDLRVLNEAPVSFRYEVVRTGVAVFVRDDDMRISFEAGVISQYLDQKPLLDRMEMIVLGCEWSDECVPFDPEEIMRDD